MLFFCLCIFFTLPTKADPESLALIMQDYKEYRLSSFWITHDFYKLDADEFYQAFAEMIALFTNKKRFQLYFDIHESEKIDPYFFRDKVLWQCKNYQYFITHTLVDIQTKKLHPILPKQAPSEDEVPLEEYGNHMYPDDWIDLQLFYCAYLDALSHYIHEIIRCEESLSKFSECIPIIECFREYTLKITDPKKAKKYRIALKCFLEIQDIYASKIVKNLLQH